MIYIKSKNIIISNGKDNQFDLRDSNTFEIIETFKSEFEELRSGLDNLDRGTCYLGFTKGIVEFNSESRKIIRALKTNSIVYQIQAIKDDYLLLGEW